MSLKNLKVFNLRTILTSAALVLSLVYLVQCQDVNDYNNNQFDNPAVLPLITQVVYSQISNLTAVIGQDIGGQSSFCIRDWWVIPLCLLKKKKKMHGKNRKLDFESYYIDFVWLWKISTI